MSKLELRDDAVSIGGVELELLDFERLIRLHLNAVADTRELELEGKLLIANGFEKIRLEDFIRRVCRWGGYAGISGRVLRRNSIAEIQSRFSSASGLLNRTSDNVGLALLEVTSLSGLATWFGSKHLRFLRPDICPVLDSIISERLGYRMDTDGYQKFVVDCQTLGRRLYQARISNPLDRGGCWYAADVEMALFARINSWLTSEE